MFSSYLSWKKGTRKKKQKDIEKKINQTNTRAQKMNTVSTYEIKVRNKQQGTRMPPTKMFVNEKMKESDKEEQEKMMMIKGKQKGNKQIKNNM